MIVAEVLGVAQVQGRLTEGADDAPRALRRTVQQLGLELLVKVKAEKLLGQVLKVRSGRLRRSINEKTVVDGSRITSSVGTKVAYGRVWELGFSGDVIVREHVRKASKGAATLVRSHVRKIHVVARPFLTPALQEMRARVLERLKAAAPEVVNGTQP